LDGGVYEDTEVIDDEADDLNCVLLGQCIVDQADLVDVAEHEDGEIGGDCPRLVVVVDVLLEGVLETGKDIAARVRSAIAQRGAGADVRFEDEGDDGLGDGGQQKGPGPPGVGDVHAALALRDRRQLCGEALAVVVAAWLRLVGLRLRRVRVAVVEGLASEEGSSSLVVRNFGGRDSRRTAGWGGSSGCAGVWQEEQRATLRGERGASRGRAAAVRTQG
jgi:hypothetical protein